MKITKNLDLSECTSFGTGGKCDTYAIADNAADLVEIFNTQPRPFWVLGSGANSLISDEGLPGTTIHLNLKSIEFTEYKLAIAESGVNWDDLVKESIANGYWGLELTSGIPGSTGAAVVGNIAAYGQAVSDTLVWVEVINYEQENPKPYRIPAKELELAYRGSGFTTGKFPNVIILKCAFQLSNKKITELKYENALIIARELDLDPDKLEDRRKIILETRAKAGSLLDKQHTQKTAGSFFKNPLVTKEQAEKIMHFEERAVTKKQIMNQNKIHGGDKLRVSAAHVLLAAGFKRGQTWGNVRLHPDHILKIENTGDATSQEIYSVAQEIIKTVKDKLGIELTPEVKFIGNFN